MQGTAECVHPGSIRRGAVGNIGLSAGTQRSADSNRLSNTQAYDRIAKDLKNQMTGHIAARGAM